jgi:ribosomal protein S18 acetylase RimI-like enzyme
MPASEAGAPAELLAWDTAFWGFPVGRVVGSLDAPAVDAWAAANAVACVYLRLDDEASAVRGAEDAGFHLVEARLRMTYERANAVPPRREFAGVVRESRDRDDEALRELTRRMRYASRFAYDPRFAARAGDYFEAWIEHADVALVAENEGRVLGYITCRIPDEGVHASFGIVAVDESARERGVGTALLEAGADWLLSRGMASVSVDVAARNIATLRYVERFGFLASRFELWFHKWYEP